MGKVPSSTTISSTAYLTEVGRQYIYGRSSDGTPIRFNSDGTDNFQVTQFALYDNDRNYRTTTNFISGQMPDIAGTSDDHCLKTASDLKRLNIIVYQGTIPQSYEETFEYLSSDFTIDAYNYKTN